MRAPSSALVISRGVFITNGKCDVEMHREDAQTLKRTSDETI